MTPKEKALELCQKYGYLGLKWKPEYRTLPLENAKQCALIAVDEIIKNSFPGTIECYWQEVKQEIEKL